jgi:hypothetical protein
MTAAKVPVPTPDDFPTPVLNVSTRFARALLEVQPVHKTRTAKVTDTFTYKYATLTDTLEAVKTACSTNGLAVAQTIVEHGDRWQIVTQIIEVDTGDSLTFPGPVMPVKGEPQAMGSALTYARRYALTTLFMLNVEDDDGQQAQRAATKPTERTEAERLTREIIAGFDKDVKQQFAADFKEQFGSTLLDLPESRHGEALSWTKWWADPANEPEPIETTAVEVES